MKWLYGLIFVVSFLVYPLHFVHAQQTSDVYEKAKVLEVTNQRTEDQSSFQTGVQTQTQVQTLKAEIIDSSEPGKVITLENDYPIQLKAGDTFYVTRITDSESGDVQYSFKDPNRLPGLGVLLFILLVLIIGIGGKQGIRGFLSLIGSLLFIVYVLLPGVLHGYSPVLVSMGVASLIVILGSYITHGFSKTTTSAVLGMVATILFTGLLAYWAIHYVHLTGFDADESVFLSASQGIYLDFAGVLLGGILIGILGILYDAAIGQAVSVDELHQVGPHLSRLKIYRRALRIGREHIGALINTLAIAYVGASLPLLLFISTGALGTSFWLTINGDLFATEITRILIGSIGLILTVPITTLVAVFLLIKPASSTSDVIKAEEGKLKEYKHTH
ncbi:MAG: hypothetical protein JWN18_747 [Parcubacteria group bacterium]|nr:hypothetical protein [Parcubacteria group bacterium]